MHMRRAGAVSVGISFWPHGVSFRLTGAPGVPGTLKDKGLDWGDSFVPNTGSTIIAVIVMVCVPADTVLTSNLQMLPAGRVTGVTGIVTFAAESRNTPQLVTPVASGSVTTFAP